MKKGVDKNQFFEEIFNRLYSPLVTFSLQITGNLTASKTIAFDAFIDLNDSFGHIPNKESAYSLLYQFVFLNSLRHHVLVGDKISKTNLSTVQPPTFNDTIKVEPKLRQVILLNIKQCLKTNSKEEDTKLTYYIKGSASLENLSQLIQKTWIEHTKIEGEELKKNCGKLLSEIKTSEVITYFKILAIALLLLSFMGTLYYFSGTLGKEMVSSQLQLIKKALPDSSLVILNSNSSLKFPKSYSSRNRAINTYGEVYVDIKPYRSSEFVLRTGPIRIITEEAVINVANYDFLSDIDIYVDKGQILILTNKDTLKLMAGERALFNKRNSILSKKDVPANNQPLAWTDRKIIFDYTPLCEVVNTLEELYRVNISIKSENINDCPIKASFFDMTILDIMLFFQKYNHLEIEYKNGSFIIDSPSCH